MMKIYLYLEGLWQKMRTSDRKWIKTLPLILLLAVCAVEMFMQADKIAELFK